ncbi:MAG: hypothetical protein M3Y56_10815 [Armatimonadota bacterium]|nr:hypothetical protein [Armatimonadota bacterium]
MTPIQQSWPTASTTAERLALLSSEGRKAAVRENRDLAALYNIHKTGIWPFCVAQALVRSTHARAAEGWYAAAARFLITGDRADLVPARGYSSSFGADALQRALLSFRGLGEFTKIGSLRAYDAAALGAAQTKSVQFAMKKELPGLGAWLFCAPFHLMALLRPSVWEDPRLDGLLLPLGSALARGYGLLQAAGVADVEESLLRDTEPGLRNGLTLLYIARGCEEKLAAAAGSRALFLHHGIAELGKAR